MEAKYCQMCGKELTGMQEKWCGSYCREKSWRTIHRERVNERNRIRMVGYAQRSDKPKEYRKTAQYRGKKIQRQRRYQENLSDTYVKTQLCNRSALQFKDIPQELVELKRAQLQLTRTKKQNREKEQCKK